MVSWNEAERSWDCPCHGSRFAVDGTVITGPAIEPLRTLAVTTDPADGRDPTDLPEPS
jgi:Rieske Fe-S protein